MSENALNGNKFGFGVEGYELSHFMLSIDTSNLVNGKPVYYLVNRRDLVMNSSTYPDVGYLALVNSSNIAVEGLTLANNGQGLLLAFTNDSRITDNNITDNEYGIWLGYSSNNSVSGNTFVNCGLIVFGYELGSYRNRVENNTVNGKPLVYLESVSDYVIENAGQVILINSSCILVENLDLSNATVGVWLWRTDSTKIVGNNLTNNLWGVFGVARGGGSLNSTISGNNITNNRFGIGLSSRNSTVSGNYVSDNLYGVWLFESANSTVTANNITNNNYLGVMVGADSDGSTISGNYVSKNGHADDIMSAGITLGSANVVVERNTIIDNYLGVRLNSPRNLLRENNISSNVEGIRIAVSPGYEQIYHNNFIENEVQVGHPEWVDPSTIWDSGYPSGGNYWSDYNGTDLLNGPDQNETGSDGIGDTAYSIDAYVIDNYPLMGMFYAFNATWQEETYRVNVISNSSVSGFDFRAIVYFETGEWLREIHFNVAGKDGTSGFCRITIPTALMNDTYTVFVNGTEVPYILLPFSNSTHSYLYFTYNHSTQEVVIIPEFPTWTPMLLILIILTVTIAITKRRLLKTPIR
jgi:parallel beta-helix repeat protein